MVQGQKEGIPDRQTDRQGGVNTFSWMDSMFTNASPCPWQAGRCQDHLSTLGNCPRKRIHEHSESIQEKQQLATHLEKEKGFLGAKRAEPLSSGEIQETALNPSGIIYSSSSLQSEEIEIAFKKPINAELSNKHEMRLEEKVRFLWTLCERQRSCPSTPEYL